MAEPFKRNRENPRIACNAAAIITTPRGTYPGVCESLSPGGAFVRCDHCPPDNRVTVIVCLPSLGPVELEGEILYRQPTGCGIRFTGPASSGLTTVQTFIGKKAA
ncbi:MAG: PilZ domain-containing protein [Myxococcales bacterium]